MLSKVNTVFLFKMMQNTTVREVSHQKKCAAASAAAAAEAAAAAAAAAAFNNHVKHKICRQIPDHLKYRHLFFPLPCAYALQQQQQQHCSC